MTDVQRMQATVERLRTKMAEAHNRASQDELNTALKIASAQIDALFRFKGEKADPNQPLSWPRKNITGPDGQPVTGVPERVQDVTYFLAGCRLLGAPFGSHDPGEQRDVLTYLLLLLDGLTDPTSPMQPPSGARPN